MKFLTTLFCTFVFQIYSTQAQIQGPLSGGSFTISVIPGSNKTWNNPGNVSSSNDTYTDFGNLTGGVGTYTDYLVVTNFGFSIPNNVTITGIIVEAERSDPNFRTADYSVRIVKSGTIGATEKSSGSSYPFSDSYQSYGNAGDLWGEAWAYTDINSSNFGVAIAAQRSVAGGTTGGRLDHIRMIVFYDFSLLPLKLLNFSALRKNHAIELIWTTSEEMNLSHYEVERSVNGREFSKIKVVASLNQIQQTTYSILDNFSVNGIVFYRLKTVENNGVIRYSKIISINNGNGNSVMLYPSLWQSGTPLYLTNPGNKKLNIYFFNTSGHLAGKSFTNSIEIPTQSISNAKGILFYRAFNESGSLYSAGKLMAY